MPTIALTTDSSTPPCSTWTARASPMPVPAGPRVASQPPARVPSRLLSTENGTKASGTLPTVAWYASSASGTNQTWRTPYSTAPASPTPAAGHSSATDPSCSGSAENTQPTK